MRQDILGKVALQPCRWPSLRELIPFTIASAVELGLATARRLALAHASSSRWFVEATFPFCTCIMF